MDASLQTRAEELAQELADQVQTIEDLNGLLRAMTKATLERMLNTEMDVHLGRRGSRATASAVSAEWAGPASGSPAAGDGKRSPNRRNGRSRKTVQGDLGEVTIATPRDREGTFRPLVIGKHQRRVPGFDEKILALYAKGMTTRDIQALVQELYDVEVSATLISEITSDLSRRGDRLADATAGGGLADRVLRRDRRPRAGRQRPRVAAHDLRGFGRESRGSQGTLGPVAQ